MLRFLKKLLYLYLSFFFFRLGVIGLIFPIIPQVPFFVLSFMFLAGASRHFRKFIVSTKIYKKFLKGYVDKHPKIAAFFYDKNDNPENNPENLEVIEKEPEQETANKEESEVTVEENAEESL